MFKLINGAKINDNIPLKEEYQIFDSHIAANISAENIMKVIDEFIKTESTERFCLFIEIPSNLADETIAGIKNGGYYQLDTRHIDVYYLDNISAAYLNGLFADFSDIFVNDGLSAFGVLSQRGNEIGKYKYNVIKAYSRDRDFISLAKVFDNIGVHKTDELVTAWDYFSQDDYGESRIYEKDGKSIYDVIRILKQVGMYKAEQREE